MRTRRWFIAMCVVFVALIGAGEVIARYGLGLGSPPLSVTHPRIEYMFAPNQDVHRFGNRQLYNEYGMRNRPLTEWGDSRRVLVFGDSVLNGGNLTDHAALATTRATNAVGDTVFGNISAGSWGPDNILGWIETYGLLDADAAILVLSAHDAGDTPKFNAINPKTHPTEAPLSALSEGISRYLPRYLPKAVLQTFFSDSAEDQSIETTYKGRDGIDALHGLIEEFSHNSLRTCVILHAERSELQSGDFTGLDVIATVVRAQGVPVIHMTDFELSAGSGQIDIYRDNIHINELGQTVLEQALLKCDAAATSPSLVSTQ